MDNAIARTPPVLAGKLIASVVRTLAARGDIDVRGKSADEIREDFHDWITDTGLDRIQFNATIDHTPDLWARAKRAERGGDLLIALTFYATWAEHRINQLLASLLTRRGHDEATTGMLLRDTGFKAKLLWLHVLLRRKPKKAFVDALTELQERRNYFVHYKWKPADENLDEQCRSTLKRTKDALGELDRIFKSRLLSGSDSELNRLERIIARDWKEGQEKEANQTPDRTRVDAVSNSRNPPQA